MFRNRRILLTLIPIAIAFVLVGAVALFVGDNEPATAAPLAQATATATFRPTRTPLAETETPTVDATETVVDEETPTIEATETEEVAETPTVDTTETEEVPETVTATPDTDTTATPAATTTPLEPIFQFTPTAEITSERTLTVQGTGQASANPDQARVRIGHSVVLTSAQEAVTEVNEQMEAIIDALVDAGVDEDDIQTTQFNIFSREPEPRPEVTVEEDQPTQYEVVQEVSVIIRDIDNAGEILDAAISAGANRVADFHFVLSDTSALEAQARVEAMRDAYTRAQDFATLADVELAGVVTIREVFDGGPRPLALETAAQAADAGVPVQAGQLSVTTQVEVVFAIE